MSVLFRCGLGLNTTTSGHEWGTTTSGTPTIDTSVYRSNGKGLRLETNDRVIHLYRSAQGVAFFRVYFHIPTGGSPTADGLSIFRWSNSSNHKIDIRMRNAANNRKLQLYNSEDSTLIGSDSGDISLDTWYRLELTLDSTTLSSTSVEARLYTDAAPSTLIWNPSGTANIAADPNRFQLGATATDATFVMVVDDFGINDNSGSIQNSWLGAGKCTYLFTDGDSSVAWSRGGTDSGANWSQLDEKPPNDVTDYVESNTNNQVDEYTLEATPSAIASDDTINWVGVGVRFTLSSSSGADPNFCLRLKSGSNLEESANISPTTTFWRTHSDAEPYNYVQFPNDSNYQEPGGSNAYTKSILDSLIIGLRETATDTHFARVSSMWVVVDHTPSAGVTVSLSSATLASSAQTITPVPGAVTVSLSAASISAQAQDVTVSFAQIVSLQSASLSSSAQVITAVPGAVTVSLNAASISSSARDITPHIPAQLVAWYKLEETGTISTFADYLGNHNATVTDGTFTSTTGVLGNAITGTTTSKASAVDHSDWDFTIARGFALSFWMKTTGTFNGSRYMLNRRNTANTNSVWYADHWNSELGFVGRDESDNVQEIWSSEVASWPQVNNGSWHFIVYCVTPIKQQIYIDGSLWHELDHPFTNNFGSDEPVILFGHATNAGWFDGSLDEIGIWNGFLTASEVSYFYDSGNGNPYIDVVALSQPNIAVQAQNITVVSGAVTVQLNAASVATQAQTTTIFSETTVSLQSATLASSGESITAVPGAVTVTLNSATLSTAAQNTTVVPGSVSVILSAGSLTAQAQTTSILSVTAVPLNAASISASGESISVIPGAVTVSLNTASLSAQAQSTSVVVGAVTVALSSAGITSSAQVVTVIPGSISVALASASLSSQAQTVTIVPGSVAVILSAASIASTAQNVSTSGEIFVSLSSASLDAQAQSVSVIPGSVTVSLASATLSSSSQVTAVPGSITVPLTAVNITSQAQTVVVVPGAVVVTLSSAILVSSAQNISISAPAPGDTVVQLFSALLTSQPQIIISVPGGVTSSLQAAAILSSAESVEVSGIVTVLLQSATLSALGQATNVIPGSVIFILSEATIYALGQSISVLIPTDLIVPLSLSRITASALPISSVSFVIGKALRRRIYTLEDEDRSSEAKGSRVVYAHKKDTETKV